MVKCRSIAKQYVRIKNPSNRPPAADAEYPIGQEADDKWEGVVKVQTEMDNAMNKLPPVTQRDKDLKKWPRGAEWAEEGNDITYSHPTQTVDTLYDSKAFIRGTITNRLKKGIAPNIEWWLYVTRDLPDNENRDHFIRQRNFRYVKPWNKPQHNSLQDFFDADPNSTSRR